MAHRMVAKCETYGLASGQISKNQTNLLAFGGLDETENVFDQDGQIWIRQESPMPSI
jgi:hypothetical protein